MTNPFLVGAVLAAALLTTSAQAATKITDATVSANGVKLHYLRAGTGPKTLILLHGWPQSAHQFEAILPELARDYTVIVPDLRGVGGSDAPEDGYDKATMAEDIHQLVKALGVKSVYLAGHDTGGMVTYAYLRTHPEDLEAAAILDVPLPGIAPWDVIEANACCWHFRFHQSPGFAESMVQGRQTTYFRYNYDHNTAHPGAISDKDLAIYAKAYGPPAKLRAGFAFFRAFEQDAAFNKSHADPVTFPVVLIGGERTMGGVLPVMADALKGLGVTNIKTQVIADSGHWLVDEQPKATTEALRAFVEAY